MSRHGAPAYLAVALVLVGSALQILAGRRLVAGEQPRPVAATVVNVVSPAAVLFVAAFVAYLRAVGLSEGSGAKPTTVVIAAALLASAAYTLVVAVIALGVVVASHGVRRAWASLWLVAATSVTAVALLPIGLRR